MRHATTHSPRCHPDWQDQAKARGMSRAATAAWQGEPICRLGKVSPLILNSLKARYKYQVSFSFFPFLLSGSPKDAMATPIVTRIILLMVDHLNLSVPNPHPTLNTATGISACRKERKRACALSTWQPYAYGGRRDCRNRQQELHRCYGSSWATETGRRRPV